MTCPIPGPIALPFLGNAHNLDLNNTVQSFMKLAETYGPIFKLSLGGDDRIFICNHELVSEVCAQKRFRKQPIGILGQMRAVVHDGLPTADDDDENWGIAHRTLANVLGPLNIKSMFDEMHDIATQMVLKWARFGPDNPIDVVADFTRLTFDTIALCAMDQRINSFYKDDLHPFVESIQSLLVEAGLRSSRPAWYTALQWTANQKFEEHNAFVHRFAAEAIARRRSKPSTKGDLVDAMLNGTDPKTGRAMSDESIENNMISFLIAGYETTEALMSFLLLYLIQNPEAYTALQAEVDEVLGTGPMKRDHINKLVYTQACLRETLRLQPTGPVFALRPQPTEDDSSGATGNVVIGGKYLIKPNQTVLTVLPKLHRDPAVYGDDAEDFKPERMLEVNFKKLPRNSWKPFGHSKRMCIGSDFAMQESILILALLFQKFDFRLADPDYKLSIQQTLAIKPHNLFVYAIPREGVDITSLPRDLFQPKPDQESA